MRKIIIVALLSFAISSIVTAAVVTDTWRAKSSPVSKEGTVKTELAGWQFVHAPDNDAKFLMIASGSHAVAAITDFPDSFEVRTFNGSSGEFITVRDKNHDRIYEEIEGLNVGTTLKLDGNLYTLSKKDGKWSLDRRYEF